MSRLLIVHIFIQKGDPMVATALLAVYRWKAEF